jgi:hypothetical protein
MRTTLDFLKAADEQAAQALDDSENQDDREVRRLHLLCAIRILIAAVALWPMPAIASDASPPDAPDPGEIRALVRP